MRFVENVVANKYRKILINDIHLPTFNLLEKHRFITFNISYLTKSPPHINFEKYKYAAENQTFAQHKRCQIYKQRIEIAKLRE